MKIVYDAYTDKGNIRDINQDAVYAYHNAEEDMAVFCVADGMGGHVDGEKASGRIIEVLSDWAANFYEFKYENDGKSALKGLSDCIEKANHDVFELYNVNGAICGSTIAILFLHGGKYTILHAGDSRIYSRRGMRLECMTRDDTWENEPSNRERFSPEEIVSQPEYHKLVKAVGVNKTLIPNVQTGDLRRKETFLLCSDGVYKYCTKKDLGRYLRAIRQGNNLQFYREKLIKSVLDNGTTDNISCVSVCIV